tara:strand:+ start:1224 stop:2168 length:945 start_codon:yes stop_codon:yes gene_type:complete
LSGTEYTFENSTYILKEIINNWKSYNGIIFYSLFQLPVNFKQRSAIYKKAIKEKKELHFVLENIVGRSKESFLKIEQIFKIKLSNLNKSKMIKLGKLRNFITQTHKKTERKYLPTMINEKIKCMKISKKYEYDYWDGDRKFGYGGYKYIPGYYTPLAKKLIKSYNLNDNSKVLDIGCGKGFLLFEIKQILKNIKIIGIDISKYAKKKSKPEVRKNIFTFDINNKLQFKDKEFDLVLCINVLHNLQINKIDFSLKEIDRVGKNSFICVESFKNEKQQFNLQCWALTAETIINTSDWLWLFKKSNYSGDYEFIFFD